MSFKVAISEVLIWSEALALVPAEPVTNISEQSLEARECRRFYKPVVAELLEQHHWGLATKRVALAQVVNDRADEWGFAYAKPDDMAFPVQMFPTSGGIYRGWYLRDGAYWSLTGRKMFEQVGGTIYSSIEAGTLEYTSFGISEADFTNLFKRIVCLELASRICQPISKNATRARELMTLSEGTRQRVIANDMNRSSPHYGDGLTESELVRFGGGLPMAGYGGRI
jgi:hypothetical protein